MLKPLHGLNYLGYTLGGYAGRGNGYTEPWAWMAAHKQRGGSISALGKPACFVRYQGSGIISVGAGVSTSRTLALLFVKGNRLTS